MKNDLQSLWKAVLTHPGDERLLRQVQVRASELLEYLDAAPGEVDEIEQQALAQHPRWLAEVHEALEPGEDFLADDAPPEDPHPAANTDSEHYLIGKAFQALVEDLPPELQRLDDWFGALPRVSGDELETLLDTPEVHAGQAVALLAERVAGRGAPSGSSPGPQPQLLALGPPAALRAHHAPALPVDAWVREIGLMTECGQLAAERLWEWLVPVSAFKRYLHPSCESFWRSEDYTVWLEYPWGGASEGQQVNLYERWAKTTWMPAADVKVLLEHTHPSPGTWRPRASF